VLTIHEALRSSRCVLLAIIHAAGILIDILLVASYLLSSMPPASSSTSNLSRLTCYHLCCRHPHRHFTCCVVLYNFPLSVPLRAVLKIHEACRSSRCILLAIIHATGIVTAILIDIVLIASYSLLSLQPASSLVSTSLMSFLLRRVSSGKLPLLLSRRAIPST